MAGAPRELRRLLGSLLAIVLEERARHCLKFNNKKGNAEAMLALRGKQAKRQKGKLFCGRGERRKQVEAPGCFGKAVCVENYYTHLGSPLGIDMNLKFVYKEYGETSTRCIHPVRMQMCC